MKLTLPRERVWSVDFQDRLNGEIERAFARFNEFAQVPIGGTSGQVLSKSTDRDLELTWSAGGGGGGGGGYPPQLGHARVF